MKGGRFLCIQLELGIHHDGPNSFSLDRPNSCKFKTEPYNQPVSVSNNISIIRAIQSEPTSSRIWVGGGLDLSGISLRQERIFEEGGKFT